MEAVIVSERVSKTPEGIVNPFVFDEMLMLSIRGLKVHVARRIPENPTLSYGMHFYGLACESKSIVLPFMLKHMDALPSLGYLIPPWDLLSLYNYGLSVSKVVRSNCVDLIHAHFAYPEGYAGLIAKRETGKPLIVTLHGWDILTEPSVNYGLRLRRRFNALICKVLREADAIITASSATYREASTAGVSKERLHLIPNGVDLKKFDHRINGEMIREKYGLEEDFVVFTLSGHEPKYGLEYLIKAIPLVARRSKRIFFVIGGDGSLRKYHELLSKSLGVEENVMFTGRIPRDLVPAFDAASNVVVVPSVQEAFGLVVAEAMASGKPVIGSKVGGIPDQIIDEHNGFLVNPRDPEAIADKILYLCDHREEAREMGRRGRKIAEEKFDIDKRIDRILSLYGWLQKK